MWSTHKVVRHRVKLPEPELSEMTTLPIDTCQFWFEALANDDVATVESTLETSQEREKNVLLNGHFDFKDEEIRSVSQRKAGRWFHMQMPLSVALSCDSFQVINSLLKHGVDPCKQDANGNNCVHSVIVAAFYMPERESRLEQAYQKIARMLTQAQMVTLLLAENLDGLRPVEFASQQGTVLLLSSILQTKGVYITRQETKGLVSYQWLDITEYETYGRGNRREKSPLLGLIWLDVCKLSDPAAKALFTSDLMKSWVSAKMKCNGLQLVAWFLIRLTHIATFFLLQADVSMYMLEDGYVPGFAPQMATNESTTDPTPQSEPEHCSTNFSLTNTQRLIVMVYLVAHSCCIVLFDVCHMLRRVFFSPPMYSTNLRGKKEWAVHYTFYRGCQFLTGALIGAGITMAIVKRKEGEDVSSYVQIASCVVSVWSMLYFVQLLPSIGHFVIVVQRMLRDLLHFIIIFIMMLTPFVQVLFVLINRHSHAGCVSDFENYLTSFYTTFKLMLNMVDLTKYGAGAEQEAAFGFLHVMYVFVVAILLINFLVALMSNSVSEVAEHKDIVMMIQRLSVAWTLEMRLGWLLAPLYRRLHPLTFELQGGRIYLARVVFNYPDDAETDNKEKLRPVASYGSFGPTQPLQREEARNCRNRVVTESEYIF